MSETRRRSKDRFSKRNLLASAKNRPRQFIQTPFGNRLTGDFLEPLADFLAGKRSDQPDKPPRFLRKQLRELNDPRFLALAALAPLLDGIFRGWDRRTDDHWLKLKLSAGEDLCRRLRKVNQAQKPFSERQRVQAGD